MLIMKVKWDWTVNNFHRFVLALFSLKKSVKEYQKRLSLLENASFENRKSVCSFNWAVGERWSSWWFVFCFLGKTKYFGNGQWQSSDRCCFNVRWTLYRTKNDVHFVILVMLQMQLSKQSDGYSLAQHHCSQRPFILLLIHAINWF